MLRTFVQLILTIGKARTFDDYLPPKFIGAFDAEKIAFPPYNNIIDIFYQNDFNWNVTPSDHDTKEFRQLYEKARGDIERGMLPFRFGADDKLHSRTPRSDFPPSGKDPDRSDPAFSLTETACFAAIF